MLVLMCYAGEGRYAVRATDVVEVTPSVCLQAVAGAPDWLSGVFAYRGNPTPVLDLTWLAIGKPCPQRWSSRILILRVPHGAGERLAGLLAERVTTDRLEIATQQGGDAGAWGSLLLDDHGIVQLIDLSRLLPDDRKAILFRG